MDYPFFGGLNMYQIIESRHMGTTTSKTIKLTRKWKKKRIRHIETFTPSPDVMMMGNTIIGHPTTIAKLRAQLPQGIGY